MSKLFHLSWNWSLIYLNNNNKLFLLWLAFQNKLWIFWVTKCLGCRRVKHLTYLKKNVLMVTVMGINHISFQNNDSNSIFTKYLYHCIITWPDRKTWGHECPDGLIGGYNGCWPHIINIIIINPKTLTFVQNVYECQKPNTCLYTKLHFVIYYYYYLTLTLLYFIMRKLKYGNLVRYIAILTILGTFLSWISSTNPSFINSFEAAELAKDRCSSLANTSNVGKVSSQKLHVIPNLNILFCQ